MFGSLQMEQENQQLKTANLKQTEQILLLQDKLQGGASAHDPGLSDHVWE